MYCRPCVLISRGLVPIPTPSFGALVIIFEIYHNFLANPLWSPPHPFLVVITLGVRDVVRRSVCKAIPPYLAQYLHLIRFFFFSFSSHPLLVRLRSLRDVVYFVLGEGGLSGRGWVGGLSTVWPFFLLFFSLSPSWCGPVAV